MDFGEAIKQLKLGKKLARKGWNGKGMFIYYVPSAKYKAMTDVAKSIADENGMVQYNPYMAIKNVDGTISTWVASINDTLSEDWIVVE